ncbi:penicillin-binding transpeptidase domain-containing protein [Metabacillus schmidteae]|uniref:penicillin-binding transpeptidase domain-containing protein n=1 Tax=Metabacillus schmidteae TaxID=2730405 RepID=UPI00158D598F|nr:PASTA domain-containing penicillin-binding protein [Metabacillus schmidteae]
MNFKKSVNMNRGSAFLAIIFLILFIVILFRFLYIMVTGSIDGVNLVENKERRITKEGILEGKKGEILTRDGEKIAIDSQVYTIIGVLNKKDPNHIKDIPDTASKLAKVLETDAKEIEQLLSDSKAYQVELGKIGRNITFSQMKEISDLELPGIIFSPDIRRTYPLGDFSSHIVGITDFDGKGISGIEKEYANKLSGTDGYINKKIDGFRGWGYELPQEESESKPPQNGNNIHTTLDTNIQTILEDSMNQVVKEYNPGKIIGIVMDPKTGEILALSNRPSIYPNEQNEVNYLNYALSSSFEPGSTMKIFTLAAAINEGVYNGNEKYKSGSIEVTGTLIHDHKKEGWGTITYDKGVQLSSNVAFTILAKDKLGFDRFYHYLQEFGFDKKTGIDMGDETLGKFVYEFPLEKATTSFGQGSTFTPIQLVTAASSIANDGKMMKPYVIKKFTDENGKTLKETQPKVLNKPISAETAKQTRELLTSVVTDGTGSHFQLNDFQVAGKTGTAQIPDGNGNYQVGRNNYMFSFLGMAPADDPRLIVYVAVEQPNLKSDQVGADPVSEIFNAVMDYGLKKLNATSDVDKNKSNTDELTPIIVDSSKDKLVKYTVSSLKEKGVEPIILGKGEKVVETAPIEGTELLKGSKVLIKTEGKMVMPDISGWSFSDVMKLISLTGLEFQHEGNGFVTSQSIAAGKEIKEGNKLSVKLEKNR